MSSREDNKEDDLQDNLEEQKDVDDADAEGNKNLGFGSKQRINVEDFEECKKSGGRTDKSTGYDGHH